MRTKTLAVIAAVAFAGVAAAVAQSNAVYSVNVVGYITKGTIETDIPTGFSIACVPLKPMNGSNVSAILGSTLPENTSVYKYTGNPADPWIIALHFGGGAWDPDPVLAPGEGFWINAPSPGTVTYVGEVCEGNDSNGSIPVGWSLQGHKVPLIADISDPVNGVPGVNAFSDALYKWINAENRYDIATYLEAGPTWDIGVSPALGEGFWYFNAGTAAIPWTRNFVVPRN